MGNRLTLSLVLMGLQGAAFWPVWRWYTVRIVGNSDEFWGLLALATFAVNLLLNGSQSGIRGKSLAVPLLLTLLYIATYPFAPRLVQGMMAVTAAGSLLCGIRLGKVAHVPSWGLLMLSLPVMPSLQFFLGYPIRVLSGLLAAPLLHLGGFAVALEGTCFNWGGQLISIDAPCSGVHMLWAGMYVSFTAACLMRLGGWGTIAAGVGSFGAVVLGNALRAAALFHAEVGSIPMPGWSHEAVGVTVFGATCCLILWITVRFSRRWQCVS